MGKYSTNVDPYLHNNICIDRLIQEHKKYGRLIVAYDFDSTVYDYHKQGYKYDRVIELLRVCRQLGFYLIVFTCNNGDRYAEMINYLNENKIPFDSINKNADFVPFKNNKIYYNILLDDRAGLASAYQQLNAVVDHIIADEIL
jgi:hydroxymethylpyrimidine pyrophosphatase-like HAD family hydrolase